MRAPSEVELIRIPISARRYAGNIVLEFPILFSWDLLLRMIHLVL